MDMKINVRGNETLAEDDPEVWQLVKNEKKRQTNGLELIASENFCSRAALEALGSCLGNKYSSGYPGSRSYGGTEVIDEIELLCQERALTAFGLNKSEWGVNVQPYSGTVANIAVYTALLKPGDKIMGLHLHGGGHFSHGFKGNDGMGSAAARYFDTISYSLHPETGYIDYEDLFEKAKIHRPKMIIAGVSAHSRLLDYKKFREICDAVGALLMADIAHICGMVAAGLIPSPFEYADVVTTTTHKTLRGVKGALIFYREGERNCGSTGKFLRYEFRDKINRAVFPGHQGGPHNGTIGGIAVALRQATEPQFRVYQEQVLKNCQAMVNKLKHLGYDMESGGTDIHLVIVDVRNKNADGPTVELVCNKVGLVLTYVPNGVRLGTPALTSRGLMEKDFEKIVDFFDQAVAIAAQLKPFLLNNSGIMDFKLPEAGIEIGEEMNALQKNIESFASGFEIPGFPTH